MTTDNGWQRIPGLTLKDHWFEIPLDHAEPQGPTIRVYAREVGPAERPTKPAPMLVFLQGGPGFAAPRPTGDSGWIGCALERGYRVLLLDQRGTGRSTPQNLETLSDLPAPEAQAAHLKHFRADAIVRDCEWIRRKLLGTDETWSVLGQSFGGFCVTHYLSAAPEGLKAAYITGGLPPLSASAEQVYRRTYPLCAARNRDYYKRYPQDVARVREVVDYLRSHEVTLPGGGQLTVRRFQQQGLALGMSDGFEPLHYLLEQAFDQTSRGPRLSHIFLHGMEQNPAFETNPLFAILHEACYTQGTASDWAAHRVRDEHPEFDPDGDGPIYFTGEMIFPWMFDDYVRLRPLKQAAELLARTNDWPQLYDRSALETNEVPCAAALYHNDMYVDREYSLETAATIADLKLWVTNEHEHNGLRAAGKSVLGRLMDMVAGKIG